MGFVPAALGFKVSTSYDATWRRLVKEGEEGMNLVTVSGCKPFKNFGSDGDGGGRQNTTTTERSGKQVNEQKNKSDLVGVNIGGRHSLLKVLILRVPGWVPSRPIPRVSRWKDTPFLD